jgi:hypothetical protein
VAGASLTGHGATDDLGTECAYATGEVEAQTNAEGRYLAQWRRRPGGTFGGCLFLTIAPPPGSELATVSIDSVRVTFYDRSDPVLPTDTLFVDAVLPPASDS